MGISLPARMSPPDQLDCAHHGETSKYPIANAIQFYLISIRQI
jgi:hypothetical protein